MSLPEATRTVLGQLSSGNSGSFTVEQLASATRINRRTVTKALDLITRIQAFTQNASVEIIEVNPRKRLVRSVPKNPAMSSLPKSIQDMVVRTQYPEISLEDKILARLYLCRAFDSKSAIFRKASDKLRKLVRQGQVARTRNGRHYLTREGKVIAESELEVYPELRTLTEEPHIGPLNHQTRYGSDVENFRATQFFPGYATKTEENWLSNESIKLSPSTMVLVSRNADYQFTRTLTRSIGNL
jgi:hypothetical protein